MSDVVLFGEDRAIGFWLMEGAEIKEGLSPFYLERGWEIIAVGDLNRDGQGDLAFQNTDRSVAIWSMDGMHIRDAFLSAHLSGGVHIANSGPDRSD